MGPLLETPMDSLLAKWLGLQLERGSVRPVMDSALAILKVTKLLETLLG